jgi:anaerobic ribonucleoside-triphosphate reductase activating protein
MINVANILKKSKTNGHGTRFVIWVQGCNRNCAGCFNQEYRVHINKSLMSVGTLFEMIKSTPDISGVTFSGGEPFLQAKELAVLARMVQEIGLTVLVFTGNSEEELLNSPSSSTHELLNYSDMVIAGEYNPRYPSKIPMIGSGNQVVMNLTGKIPNPENDDIPRIEIVFGDDGIVNLSGFPTEQERQSFVNLFSSKK